MSFVLGLSTVLIRQHKLQYNLVWYWYAADKQKNKAK